MKLTDGKGTRQSLAPCANESDLKPTAVPASSQRFVLNFAYGSNLLTRRIQERAPSAQVVSVATLAGHRLCWHKRGRDGSGKCDVLPTGDPSDRVIGVIYRLTAADKRLLDLVEGLGAGYAEKEVSLETPSGPVRAWTYCAIDIDPALLPFDWYRALVVAGAREHGFPGAYLAGLDATPSCADPDSTRARRHFELAGMR